MADFADACHASDNVEILAFRCEQRLWLTNNAFGQQKYVIGMLDDADVQNNCSPVIFLEEFVPILGIVEGYSGRNAFRGYIIFLDYRIGKMLIRP